jgi:hypothetical protein
MMSALVLSFAYYHQGWVHPQTDYIGNPGDSEQMVWFLAWTSHALVHGHSPLVGDYVLFPQGENLMWNTSILLPGVLLAPVTLTIGPVVAYNLLITLAPIATAGTTYLLFARFVRRPFAVAVGSITFAFCPFILIHSTAHPQLSVATFVPLMALLVHEAVVEQRWRWGITGVALGVAGAAPPLTGEELLEIAILAVVVMILVLALSHPDLIVPKLRYAGKVGALAAAVFAVLVGYPLHVQYQGPLRPVGSIHDPATFVTDLGNFLQPVGQVINVGILHHVAFTGDPTEWTGYIGFPLLLVVLIVAFMAFRTREVVRVGVTIIVAFAIFALGPHLHLNGRSEFPLPWSLVDHLPTVDQILPGRLTVIVALASTLLLAVFVEMVLDAPPVRLALGAAVILGVVAFWVPDAVVVSASPVPTFFTTSEVNRLPAGSVALVAPYINGDLTEYPLLWQAVAHLRFRMIDGQMIVPGDHFGPVTVLSTTLTTLQTGTVPLTPSLRSTFTSLLGQDEVGEIVVGPGPGQARNRQFFQSLLGRPSDLRGGGVEVWLLQRGG